MNRYVITAAALLFLAWLMKTSAFLFAAWASISLSRAVGRQRSVLSRLGIAALAVVSSRMARRYADPDQASHYALFGQRMRIAIILLLTPTICAKVLHYIWKL